ncbi:MAG: hypothetical protein ACWA6U_01380 [Breznakibacter sp.]
MLDVNWFLLEVETARKRSKQVLAKIFFMVSHAEDDEAKEDSGILFNDLTGLSTVMFPNIQPLTQEELSRMVLALVDLYHSYGLNPVFYPRVSIRIKYAQMRDFCHQLVYPNPGQMVDVEFCDYRSGMCPYASDCHLAHLLVNNCLVYRVHNKQELS